MPFENVQNLLQSDQTLTWRSAPQCPKCHQLFTASHVARGGGPSRRAFILKCDHLLCERCIQDQLQVRSQAGSSRASDTCTIHCRVCNIGTLVNPRQRIPEQLQHSYHLLGFVYQRQYEMSRLGPRSLSSSMGPAAPGCLQEAAARHEVELEDDTKECFECNVTHTRHYCQECDTPLCRDCFNKIHRVGKVLAKHKMCSLSAKQWLRGDVGNCDEHQRVTELFCTSCETRVCSVCRDRNHALHFCVPLEQVNRDAQPRLEELLRDMHQAYAMNEQGRKHAEQVLEHQKEHADKVISEITEYFFSLHCLLQSAEQELLHKVKENFVALHKETVTVQKELRTSERNLQRSIDQFQSFQVSVPRQALLGDLIRDMKKMLHKVPVTAQFQEPRENPFRFQEREPLRKEIHNYFELKYKPNAYRTKLLPYHDSEPFPVLDPLAGAEQPRQNPPEPKPPAAAKPAAISARDQSDEPLNQSSASTDHTPKDMDISNHSSLEVRTPDGEIGLLRDCLSLGSGGTAGRCIKTEPREGEGGAKRKDANSKPQRKPSQHPARNRHKTKSQSPDVEIVYEEAPRQFPSRRNSNTQHHHQQSSKRPALGKPPKPQAAVPATSRRSSADVGPSVEINPANPHGAQFLKLTQEVNVSSVYSPHKFYVQHQKVQAITAELCHGEAPNAETPDQIHVGALYLVRQPSSNRWFRGQVMTQTKNGKRFEVFFIDYGRVEQVQPSDVRELSAETKACRPGAEECALYDLLPADGKWKTEAKQIMIDFIDNQRVMMYIIDAAAKPLPVDVIVKSLAGYKSLRSTLVYLNLAKPDPKPPIRGAEPTQKITKLAMILRCWSVETVRLPQRALEKDDVFKVKITHSRSPSEFFVRRSAWQDEFAELQHALTKHCTREHKVAYLPHAGMMCAFAERDAASEQTVWRRGQVLRVGDAHCDIVSVDTGHQAKAVEWHDICYLAKPFYAAPPFAVCCKLMHIQPFKQHKYRWTEEAAKEFNQLATSSYVFQVIVGDRLPDEEHCHEVALYALQKRHDICLNALLVRNGFAVSTGPESVSVERIKDVAPEDDEPVALPPANLSVSASGSNNDNAADRTTSTTSERRRMRVRVEILRVVSPGEFYVTLWKNLSAIERMHDEIQSKMEDKLDEAEEKTRWKEGEMCVVFPTVATKQIGCDWYRAEIREVIDDSNYTVFLIDRAHTMNMHYMSIRSLPAGLRHVQPAAIRCLLACVVPTGNQDSWSPSAIDAFQLASSKFQCFSISVHGRSQHKELPVILWGMTAEHARALSPQLFQYTNVNNNLAQYGYVHQREKFPPLSAAIPVEEELTRLHESIERFLVDMDMDLDRPAQVAEDPSFAGSCELYQDEITTDLVFIDRWLPARPIDKTIFVGMPTYVDNNGVIYLHDVQAESTLEALKVAINARFGGSQPLPADKFYADNEPCVAKFHMDERFYRAVVRQVISPCRYKVQFVDYGNIEECDVGDLRKSVVCAGVPILVNRYRLSNVSPAGGGVWSLEALDTLHSLVVGKQCQVRVDTDMDTDQAGVIPCFLKTTETAAVEVADYLLQLKLVERKRGIFEERRSQLDDPYMCLGGSARSGRESRMRIAANFGSGNNPDDSGESVARDYRGAISQKEMDDLFEYVAAENRRSATAEFEEGEESGEIRPEDELNRVQYFFSYDHVKQEPGSDSDGGGGPEGERKSADGENSSTISFNPNEFDTSTQIDPPLELSRPTQNGYPQFEIEESIKGFYCEVTNLSDTFNLYVFPQLDDHIQRMKELMARIQCYARKHRKCMDIEKDMPCLALFKQDGFWYRGVIKEDLRDQGEVQIFYVDYLNTERVSARDVIKCPVPLRNVQLRNVLVKLHALQPNPRMRDSDIRMKLVELIENKRIYAKITQRTPKLEVELYTDSKCSNLVYHRLIKEKYFLVGGNEAGASSNSAFGVLSRRRE